MPDGDFEHNTDLGGTFKKIKPCPHATSMLLQGNIFIFVANDRLQKFGCHPQYRDFADGIGLTLPSDQVVALKAAPKVPPSHEPAPIAKHVRTVRHQIQCAEACESSPWLVFYTWRGEPAIGCSD